MLDDSVMFARRLRNLGQPVTLRVVEDLPHGFLTLAALCRETRQAAERSPRRLDLHTTATFCCCCCDRRRDGDWPSLAGRFVCLSVVNKSI